jgi:hypothetical protein
MSKQVKTLDGSFHTNIDYLILNFKYGEKRYPLKQKHKELLERWNFADNLIRRNYPNKTVVDMMKKKFGKDQATHYRDVKDAKRFFGSMSLENKDYEKILQKEMLEKAIKMCFEKKDMKSLGTLMKERRLLLGLDRDANGQLTPDLLGGNQIIVQLKNGDETKSIRLDTLDNIEEVDFEEILDKVDVTKASDEAVLELLDPKDESSS